MRGIIHYSQKSLKTTSKKSRFEKKIQSSFLTPQKMARPVCTSWVFSYHIAIVESSVYTLSNFWTFGPDFLSFYCITCFQKTHTFKDPRGFLSVIYHLFKERTFKGQRGFFFVTYHVFSRNVHIRGSKRSKVDPQAGVQCPLRLRSCCVSTSSKWEVKRLTAWDYCKHRDQIWGDWTQRSETKQRTIEYLKVNIIFW